MQRRCVVAMVINTCMYGCIYYHACIMYVYKHVHVFTAMFTNLCMYVTCKVSIRIYILCTCVGTKKHHKAYPWSNFFLLRKKKVKVCVCDCVVRNFFRNYVENTIVECILILWKYFFSAINWKGCKNALIFMKVLSKHRNCFAQYGTWYLLLFEF